MTIPKSNCPESAAWILKFLLKWILATILLLFSLVQPAQASERQDPVRIGVTGSGSYNWPAYALQSRLGTESEEFAIEFVPYWDYGEAVDALAAGSLDILMAAPIEILVQAVNTYEDIRIVAGESERAPYLLVTSSDVKSTESLKGHIVGVSNYFASIEMLLEEQLARSDLVMFRDYKIREIGGSRSKMRALQAGMVSGAYLLADVAFDTADSSDLRLVIPDDGFPKFPFSVTAINRCFGQLHPKKTDNLVAASRFSGR